MVDMNQFNLTPQLLKELWRVDSTSTVMLDLWVFHCYLVLVIIIVCGFVATVMGLLLRDTSSLVDSNRSISKTLNDFIQAFSSTVNFVVFLTRTYAWNGLIVILRNLLLVVSEIFYSAGKNYLLTDGYRDTTALVRGVLDTIDSIRVTIINFSRFLLFVVVSIGELLNYLSIWVFELLNDLRNESSDTLHFWWVFQSLWNIGHNKLAILKLLIMSLINDVDGADSQDGSTLDYFYGLYTIVVNRIRTGYGLALIVISNIRLFLISFSGLLGSIGLYLWYYKLGTNNETYTRLYNECKTAYTKLVYGEVVSKDSIIEAYSEVSSKPSFLPYYKLVWHMYLVWNTSVYYRGDEKLFTKGAKQQFSVSKNSKTGLDTSYLNSFISQDHRLLRTLFSITYLRHIVSSREVDLKRRIKGMESAHTYFIHGSQYLDTKVGKQLLKRTLWFDAWDRIVSWRREHGNKHGYLVNRKVQHHFYLELVWTVIPFLMVVAVGVPSLLLLYGYDMRAYKLQSAVVITAVGHQWYWSYEYHILTGKATVHATMDSYMVETTNLTIGQPRLLAVDNRLVLPACFLNILVTSTDVIHSWTIPTLGIKLDAVPGRVNQLVVDLYPRYGTFWGQCSELCGVMHGFMPIEVSIVPYLDFLTYLHSCDTTVIPA